MFRPLLLFIGLVAAACGPAAPAVTTPPTSVPTTAPTVAAPTLATGATVSVAGSGYFVGPNGMTLYTFDRDAADTSLCVGDCLTNWPPLTVAGAEAITVGSGLDTTEFGTLTRTDGALQVTFNHVPLYYYAGDSAPGDTKGDGVGGVWHLATASSSPPALSPSPTAVSPTINPTSTPHTGETLAPVTPAPFAKEIVIGVSGNGNYLVDPDGFALYTFDNDAPNESNCTGDCSDNWPPLGLEHDEVLVAGEGVDGMLGSIHRDDESHQVTYNEQPLYRYSGDNAPGETNGDGVVGKWHLAQP